MRCKFPQQDLIQRLDNTVCLYRGRPYMVKYYAETVLSLYELGKSKKMKGDTLHIRSDDPEFDVSTPPLGYVQLNPTRVGYVSRRPIRMFKQGLTNDVVHWTTIPNEDKYNEDISFDIFTEQFENMVLGNYPSLEVVFSHLSKSPDHSIQVAISRDVAFEYRHKLQLVFVYYKGEEVGYMQVGSRRVIIPSSERAWIISRHLSGFGWEVE